MLHLVPTPETPLTLFWTEGPPYALFAFRRPACGHVPRALGGQSDPDHVAHLDRDAARAAHRAAAELAPAFRTLLRDPNASVADVLAASTRSADMADDLSTRSTPRSTPSAPRSPATRRPAST